MSPSGVVTPAVRRDLPSLTGLRFLGAAAVVFCHASHILGPGTLTEQFARIGYVGVEFFFVLSGFVLTWSFNPRTSVSTFYRRRFARIYPLYITTWVAVAVAAELFDVPGGSTLGVVLGVFVLQAWFPQQQIFQAANTPGWSLSAEAFFYALFPFIVRRLPRWRWTALLLICTIMVVGIAYAQSPLYSVWFAYYSPLFGLLYFVAGMTLAQRARSATGWFPPLPVCLALLVTCFLLCGAVASERPKGFVEALMLPSIVILIVSAARSDVAGVRTLWSRSVLTHLGQWSFAVYLVHWGLLGLVQRLVDVRLNSWQTLVAAVAVVVVATAAAAVLHYGIERPAERWIRGGGRRVRPAEDLPPPSPA